MSKVVAIRAVGISKAFPGVQALRDVSWEICGGEVHALVGQNGAGKSTLVKILVGAYVPDSGQILVEGRAVNLRGPRSALENGIVAVHQELDLVPDLSVAENIMLGAFPARRGRIVDWREVRRRAESLIGRLGFDIPVDLLVRDLTVAQKQVVAIAKALRSQARVVILDEASAALTSRDLNTFFKLIRSLRNEGCAVGYVTHRIKEVFDIADRVTVIKDGIIVGTHRIQETSPTEIVREMVGKDLAEQVPLGSSRHGETVLEVLGVSRRGVLKNISFTLRAGEILGLAGLVGSGRTELFRAIYGADRIDAGQIKVMGRVAHIRSPKHAVKWGLGMVPEDRRTHGLFLRLDISKNLTISNLPGVGGKYVIHPRREGKTAEELISRLRIVPPNPRAIVNTLSGGNQQKVLLGRWIHSGCKVLLADDPTRGVDVGAKQEIYKVLRGLAQQGVGILLTSSELGEVVALADRVLVLREGQIVAELPGGLPEERVMAYAAGLTDGGEQCK